MNLKNYYHIGDVARAFDMHPNYITMLSKEPEYEDAFIKIGRELFINLDPYRMRSTEYLTSGLRKAYKEHKSDIKHFQSLEDEKEKTNFKNTKGAKFKHSLALKDWSGKFPLTTFKEELSLSNDDIKTLEENNNIKVKTSPTRDSASDFKYVEYGPTLANVVSSNNILYKVTKSEYEQYVKDNTAKGHIDLGNDQVLMWY